MELSILISQLLKKVTLIVFFLKYDEICIQLNGRCDITGRCIDYKIQRYITSRYYLLACLRDPQFALE